MNYKNYEDYIEGLGTVTQYMMDGQMDNAMDLCDEILNAALSTGYQPIDGMDLYTSCQDTIGFTLIEYRLKEEYRLHECSVPFSDIYFLRAHLYLAKEEYNDALDCLMRALEWDASFFGARQMILEMSFSMENFSDEILFFIHDQQQYATTSEELSLVFYNYYLYYNFHGYEDVALCCLIASQRMDEHPDVVELLDYIDTKAEDINLHVCTHAPSMICAEYDVELEADPHVLNMARELAELYMNEEDYELAAEFAHIGFELTDDGSFDRLFFSIQDHMHDPMPSILN